MFVGYKEMFVEYEVLDKNTEKNASKLFFKAMKKLYKGKKKGEKITMCPRGRDVNVRIYKIGTLEKNNDVYVSNGFFYKDRLTSLIVYGDNQEEISIIQSRLEKETSRIQSKLEKKIEFELKKVMDGN